MGYGNATVFILQYSIQAGRGISGTGRDGMTGDDGGSIRHRGKTKITRLITGAGKWSVVGLFGRRWAVLSIATVPPLEHATVFVRNVRGRPVSAEMRVTHLCFRSAAWNPAGEGHVPSGERVPPWLWPR